VRNGRKFSIMPIAVDEQTLKDASGLSNSDSYSIEHSIPHYASEPGDLPLLENLRRDQPDIFLVDFDESEERARRTVAHIRKALPSAVVFAVATKSAPETIISAMRAGCTEYLIKPLSTSRFNQALLEFEKQRMQHVPAAKRGRVASLLGVKGGVGVTALAVHLATFAARLERGRVLLIDQHPDLGDVSVYLGLGQDRNRYHFYELVANLHRLDRKLLDGFVLQHESGLEVLTSPDAFDAMKVSTSNIEGVIEALRDFYDLIILDCAHGLTGFNVCAIEKSDKVYLVTTPEFPAVRNLARFLDHLARFKCPEEKIEVVLNRDSKRNTISKQHVESAIKRPVSLLVPNDYQELIEAINAGRPLQPSSPSEMARPLQSWAESLVGSHGQPGKQVAKKRFGILGI